MAILDRFDYSYDFMGIRYKAMGLSILLVVISFISFFAKGFDLGIDFTGGTLIEVFYKQPANLQDVRKRLHDSEFSDAVVQNFGTSHDVLIRIGIHENLKNQELSNKVLNLLSEGGVEVEMRRVEFVGSQVGSELIEKGAMALLVTTIGILIYVALRFELRLAAGAVLALMHDPIIIMGIFSLFDIEFDLTVLAAILAVIGYSINDTIVVFDRLRDNAAKMRKHSFLEIINVSTNQMLGRTIMTSATTFLVVVVLFLFGGELIRGFSLALIIGIVIGTYSSIYVASALALALGVSRNDLIPVQKEGADVHKG